MKFKLIEAAEVKYCSVRPRKDGTHELFVGTQEECEKFIAEYNNTDPDNNYDLVIHSRTLADERMPRWMRENSEFKICCICKKPFDGYGNNAEPVCSGSCCDECNMKEVIPARMKILDNSSSKDLDEAKSDDVLPGQISIFDNFRKFVELPTFRKDWRAEGLTEDDLRDLQNQILNNPETAVDLGDKVFKIRFAPKSMNKGKSGAYRIFYIDIIMQETIYLVGILDKADAANLSKEEVNAFRDLANVLKHGGI